jgi:hypothetical protein
MSEMLSGVVVSDQLARFGGPHSLYGFLGIEKDDGTVVKLKIDAYTDYDDFKVGDSVEVEVAPLGDTKILVIKKLHKVSNPLPSMETNGSEEHMPA